MIRCWVLFVTYLLQTVSKYRSVHATADSGVYGTVIRWIFGIQGKMCRSFLDTMSSKVETLTIIPTLWLPIASLLFHWLQTSDFDWLWILILCWILFCASMFGALKRGRFRSLDSLILVVNVVGELQPKRTLAASRGFLAAARLSCLVEVCSGIADHLFWMVHQWSLVTSFGWALRCHRL